MSKPDLLQPVSLPNNIEAETNLLGSLLRNNAAIPEALAVAAPDDFYRDNHRTIAAAIKTMAADRGVVDLSLLVDSLKQSGNLEKAGGYTYLTNILENVPVPGNAVHYARIVRRESLRRQIINETSRIQQSVLSGVQVNGAVKRLAELQDALELDDDWQRHILDGHEIVKRTAGQVEWIASPIVRQKTITLFAAAARQGKTKFVEALALHVALGRSFGRFMIEKPRNVVYFIAEDDEELTGDRMRALARGIGAVVPAGCRFIFRPYKVGTPKGDSTVRSIIEKTESELAIFDTLSHYHAGKENESESMTEVMEHFTAIARETKAAIILLHHHRKSAADGDEGEAIEKSRGSGAIVANCPIVISGRRQCYKIYSKFGSVGDFAVRLEEGDGPEPYEKFVIHDPMESEDALDKKQKILQAIDRIVRTTARECDRNAIVEETQMHYNTVKVYLKELEDAGQVTTVKGAHNRLLYRVADNVPPEDIQGVIPGIPEIE